MQKKKIILLTTSILIILSIILLILNTNKPMPQNIKEQAKANYTTEIGTQTYDITNALLEPKGIIPTISAGMIPIKWNGSNWIITTRQDKQWYDYTKGQPAYIMLNDGYYKSELEQGITSEQLMENAVGNETKVVPNVTDNNPTIYMYIPRFAYNNQGEILYIKQACSVAGTYTIPEIFTYQTEKRDFSLAGIWVECTPLANTSEVNTKINKMNGPNNTYGFIANTIATNANNEPAYKATIEIYNQHIANIVNGTTGASFPTDSTTDANTVGEGLVSARTSEEYPNTVGASIARPQIDDISNTNRTILKITNTNQLEPIKAYGYYDETEEKIKIEVTYRTNAISQIIDANNNILSKNSTTAETTNANQIFVVDNKGNYKKVKIKDIYIISNKLELEEFRNDVNKGLTTANTRAFQIADIELNEGKYTIDEVTGEITFAEDAEQWEPIGDNYSFYGIYEGNGHKITGIYINHKDNGNQGLFGSCRGAQIKNIGIENGYIYGNMYVGGIVGYLTTGDNRVGKIYGCYNKANIIGYNRVGGIVGQINGYYNNKHNDCIVESCYNVGKIQTTYWCTGGIVGDSTNISTIRNCYNIGNVIGSERMTGGIVSSNYRGTIENCYNLGRINGGTSENGGIAGFNYGADPYTATLSFCYNTGNVLNGSAIAGVNGDTSFQGRSRRGKITECYYLSNGLNGVGKTVSGSTSTTYARTQDQMPTVISVINSDNAFVEDTEGINNGYPLLAWQVEATN